MDEKQNEFIAFKGKEFTIEWYFDSKNKSASLEYFEALDDKNQIKLLQLFELMGNTGQIKNKEKFNNEGDKIYAFKPQPIVFYVSFLLIKKLLLPMHFIRKQISFLKMKKTKH